ncbi:MAG: hypothetical protein NTY84_11465 [Verrucomicrobia bacterium]|nr:hypothetical protein [Verrucomicrobiota bacterium]
MTTRLFKNKTLSCIGVFCLLINFSKYSILNAVEPSQKDGKDGGFEKTFDKYKESFEFTELVQIGIKNGFVGKDSVKTIMAKLNYGNTNKSNKVYFDGRDEIYPKRDKIEEAAFLFGLENCDQKNMKISLLIHGRPFRSENNFFRILDQRLRMQVDSKTPDLEKLALKNMEYRCIYTSGGMFSEKIHRIPEILEVARLESFKKPVIANIILRQLWHVIDGPKSYYNAADMKEGLKYMAVESTADEDAVNHIFIKLVCPELAQENQLTEIYKPNSLSWKSEVPKAAIWYLYQIRKDSLRARKVLDAIKVNCKSHAIWIQEIESGRIDEEIGFTKLLKQSQIAKDQFKTKAVK